MDKSRRSAAMIVTAMVIFGTLGPFVRNIPVTSGELALYRAIMAVVLIAAFLLVTGDKINFREIRREVPLLVVSGVAIGINWILLFEAYNYTTVSVATLSYYFAPVIVTIVCPLLFREKMTPKKIFCFIMSTVGLVLIIGITDLGGGSSDLTGIAFGLGAAVFYATAVILNKFIKGVAGLHRTLLQFLAAVVVLIPYVACTSGVTLETMDATGWYCLLIVGVVHTGVAYCFYFSAIKEVPGQEVAILSYVDPLVAIIVSVTVLGEAMLPMQIAGGIMVLGFTLWNEIEKKS